MGPILIAIVIFVLIVSVVAPRMNELFLISVRRGRVLVIRGRVPARLRGDFAEIVKRSNIHRATIRAIKAESHARLVVRGMDENTAQRLRNTFGIHPISKLRVAQASSDQRNFGQRLGWIWLSWLLYSRRR